MLTFIHAFLPTCTFFAVYLGILSPHSTQVFLLFLSEILNYRQNWHAKPSVVQQVLECLFGEITFLKDFGSSSKNSQVYAQICLGDVFKIFKTWPQLVLSNLLLVSLVEQGGGQDDLQVPSNLNHSVGTDWGSGCWRKAEMKTCILSTSEHFHTLLYTLDSAQSHTFSPCSPSPILSTVLCRWTLKTFLQQCTFPYNSKKEFLYRAIEEKTDGVLSVKTFWRYSWGNCQEANTEKLAI